METPCRVPGRAAPSASTTFSPVFTQLHGVSVHVQAHTGTHIHRLPGAAPSVSLTSSLARECWAWPHPVSEHRHLETCTEIYVEKETGAKIETYMRVRRGTCSDRHLWKQTPASRRRGSAHSHSTYMWTHTVREARTPRPAHPQTRQMQRRVETHEGSARVVGPRVPPTPVHSQETKAASNLIPEAGFGAKTPAINLEVLPSPGGSCSPREHPHPASRQ